MEPGAVFEVAGTVNGGLVVEPVGEGVFAEEAVAATVAVAVAAVGAAIVDDIAVADAGTAGFAGGLLDITVLGGLAADDRL